MLAIVWLYRGDSQRFVALVSRYCDRVLDEGKGCFSTEDERGLPNFLAKLNSLREVLVPFLDTLGAEGAHSEASEKLTKAVHDFEADGEAFQYVGVAPEEEDEDFDFREALREIHEELDELNAEAVTLAATIKENFEELEI